VQPCLFHRISPIKMACIMFFYRREMLSGKDKNIWMTPFAKDSTRQQESFLTSLSLDYTNQRRWHSRQTRPYSLYRCISITPMTMSYSIKMMACANAPVVLQKGTLLDWFVSKYSVVSDTLICSSFLQMEACSWEHMLGWASGTQPPKSFYSTYRCPQQAPDCDGKQRIQMILQSRGSTGLLYVGTYTNRLYIYNVSGASPSLVGNPLFGRNLYFNRVMSCSYLDHRFHCWIHFSWRYSFCPC
jgi:hypothetical protein